jgi:hypothetical protein
MQNMSQTKMQNMLYLQNVQYNMYKICNEYAVRYAEYVNKYAKEYAKYAKSFSDMQNMSQTKMQNMLYLQNVQYNMYKYATNMQKDM